MAMNEPLPADWMPLSPHDLPPITEEEERFLAGVAPRVRAVTERGGSDRVVAFIPADYGLISRALRWIRDHEDLPGDRFLEWGSGVGIVTCLAALHGFRAEGLEIEEGLVEEARRIAAEFGLPGSFRVGSYREEGDAPLEADLVYVYPWPAEETLVFEQFRKRARPGTRLLSYHGGADLRVRTAAPS